MTHRNENSPRPLGHTEWAIAEGYIPAQSTGPEPAMTSHETVCVLNAGEEAAEIEITIYFSDRDPIGPFRHTVGPRRVRHVRINELEDPEPVPLDTDYGLVLISSAPVVVQHTRLDSRQAENALLSTIAFAQA